MPLNTAPLHDIHDRLAEAATLVQRAEARVRQYQALPESDPMRACRVRLAYVVLDHHRAAWRRLVTALEADRR